MVASAVAFARSHLAAVLVGAGLVLAGGCGAFAGVALGFGSAAPARTVTINVATGPTGPQGPAGPQGPPGVSGTCPNGFTAGELVINHPGGQTVAWVCLKD